jgi:hypothetical protein
VICPHGAQARRRCTRCVADYMRDYMRSYRRRSPRHRYATKHAWLQAAILSHLTEAPAPVGPRDLLALTGGRDETGIRAAVYRARRAGHPIVGVKTGRTVRYVLVEGVA